MSYSVDRIRESMVKVLSHDETQVAGSGFIIKADGDIAYLITCHHVIFSLEKLKVEYRGEVCDAEWCEEYSGPDKDIAVLKINVEDAQPLPITIPQEFSWPVIVYGFPPSKAESFSEGYNISAQKIEPSAPVNTLSTYPNIEIKFKNLWNKLPGAKASFLAHRIYTDMKPGTSGGPVFSEELAGVVGVAQSSEKGESFAIRWDNIRDILDKMGLDPQKNAVCQFLEDIEKEFEYMELFHCRDKKIAMEDQPGGWPSGSARRKWILYRSTLM